MSLLAPFFSSTSVASTLLTAAAQWRADLPAGKPTTSVTNRGAIFSSTKMDKVDWGKKATAVQLTAHEHVLKSRLFTVWKSPRCDIPLCYQDPMGLSELALGFFFCFIFKITYPDSYACSPENPSISNPVLLLLLSQDCLTKPLCSSLQSITTRQTAAGEPGVSSSSTIYEQPISGRAEAHPSLTRIMVAIFPQPSMLCSRYRGHLRRSHLPGN